MHLSWTAWQTIVGAAVFGLTLTLALVALGRFLIKQNNQQLAEARRMSREVFGEDPDNPNGPKGPSIRVMLNQMIDQTRPLVATVEEHGRRLGKHDAELIDLSSRVTAVESVVIRSLGGSATTGPGS